MKKKHTKEKWEIAKQQQMTDEDFMIECGKILQMEVTKRLSSHDSVEEEWLSLYATDEQWKKHPMMYELIMGDGLDDDLFELAINQEFYVVDRVFKTERTDKGELKVIRIK